MSTVKYRVRNPAVRPLSVVFAGICAFFLSAPAVSAATPLSSIRGTIWEKAAQDNRIDPLLMYAVALYESRQMAGEKRIAPHPFALNSKVSGSLFPATRAAAEATLAAELKKTSVIDVCPMQINVRWNGNRVPNPKDLLELSTCLNVGAKLLSEAVLSAPGDLELGIGRYHTWNQTREGEARQYGRNVMQIWINLIRAS